ncbi:MAG TPA: response regulator, partial [Kofleriaceae bacterium]|nr:response regulator [Kofleriaceae bacterium]
MTRRILLIDADPAFRAQLTQLLTRYRFEIVTEPDADAAVALAGAAPPALLVVSVEEPEKVGFKIFQRCKRGALTKVPIMLVTSSVTPGSFAKHRGLKVHADEYVDKRTLSNDELLGKLDALIGLGEPADAGHGAEGGLEVEVDEIPLSSDDMVLEETVGEDEVDVEGDLAAQPAAHGEAEGDVLVDSMVDAETDAAFAALLSDDMFGGGDAGGGAPAVGEPAVGEPAI